MADEQPAALRLERAKQDFEEKLHDTLRSYERRTDGGVEIDLDLDDPTDGPKGGDLELRTAVRNLAEAFHAQGVVYETGVTATHLTAIDSDADGTIAINVKYEYPV
jgi:glycine/D-amino acid oxidase-like deaminating enzyme